MPEKTRRGAIPHPTRTPTALKTRRKNGDGGQASPNKDKRLQKTRQRLGVGGSS